MTKKNNPYLSKDRLEMFCDGVFAIAITLLILEIKIPKQEQLHAVGGLYNYLLKIWPNYLSYIITFISIGIYWSNHHWLFSFIKKTDHVLNLLSIVFLMTIAFLPFTTAILGDFILDPENKNAAVFTYCFGYLMPIPAVTLVAFYAFHKHRLVDKSLCQKFINRLYIKLFSGMTICLVSVILSFKYPNISLALVAIAFIGYLLPPETPVYTTID